MTYDYDLLVIGSGPAGHRAAIQAAKLEKRVAVVEKKAVVGGVCINTGTIPSKTLREAALRLSGYRERGIYGASYTVKQHITMRDLLFRVDQVVHNEIDVARHQLLRNNVDILNACASFIDPHRVRLDLLQERVRQEVTAAHIVIGAGVIGLEYASIFAALGVRVMLIDVHDHLLPFVDREFIDALTYHLRTNRATLY